LLLAQEAYNLSTKHQFLKGECWALNKMAGAFYRLGNYTQALQYYIQQLKIEEQRGYADNIAIVNMNIALVYIDDKDASNAFAYALKADSIITKNKIDNLVLYSLLNLGDIAEKANKLSLALSYTQNCYAQSLKNNDSIITGTALNNLGNIYSKTGDINQAISSYAASIPYLKAMQDNDNLSECTLGLAKSV
jgi:tetratricopeptide (TPR) repeat protein